ncbi:MFS transporter [Desulfuromonas versatilis]|uniref:MFS transporter n=1 Tax=Desulfuromonas versatilis TaxID=2802975 RepID=A0ABM8I052_9BACT|nr:MFS transporter [Desulfuromonas versatilis]BCR06222.1 MFS transporter [Desulfuromonas versatilis]
MIDKSSRWPFHYGWVIVLTGALTLFACLGLARFAFGMLLPAMREGLGLSYDQMGWTRTGNFVGYLVSVALAPLLIRHWRPRATMVFGLLLIALCMLGISICHGLLPVVFLYALVGVGSGFANIPVMVLVSHWFRRERRGRAAGMMVMGNGAAIIFSGILIPWLNRLLGPQGWRTGWLVLGLITLAAGLLAAVLVRNDPAEMGLEPVGRKVPLPTALVEEQREAGSGRILAQLGLLYHIFGATYMVYGTFIVTTMVVEFGFAEARAGMFWSWVGFFSLFSGVGFGTLSDRVGRRGGLGVVFAIQTLAYLLAGSAAGEAALLLSVMLYGLSAFAIPTIMAAAVGDYLGLARAPAAFSLITVFFAIGQALGPGAAGLAAEAAGSFTISFLAAAALTACGALLTLLLPPQGAKKGGRA